MGSIQEDLLEISDSSVQCLGSQDKSDDASLPKTTSKNVDLPSDDDLDSEITNQVMKASLEIEKTDLQLPVVPQTPAKTPPTTATAYDWAKENTVQSERSSLGEEASSANAANLNPPKPETTDTAPVTDEGDTASDLSTYKEPSSMSNLSVNSIITRREIELKDAKIVFDRVYGQNRNFEDFKRFLMSNKLSASMTEKNCTALIRKMNNIARNASCTDEEKRDAVLHAGTVRDLAKFLEKEGANIDSSKLPPTKVPKTRPKVSTRSRSASGRSSNGSEKPSDKIRRNSTTSKDQKANLIKDVCGEGTLSNSSKNSKQNE